MRARFHLFLLSLICFTLFIFLSYTVAKEMWQKIDFDATVKLQDRIPRDFDQVFSYFSIMGSAEVTVAIAAFMALSSLIRLKMGFLGWSMIIPASIIEVAGKLFIFHPGPSVLFHRTIIETELPSFYIHTNFSYPSGHVTRTIFLVTAFLTVTIFEVKNIYLKLSIIILLLTLSIMMVLTRLSLGEHWLSDILGGVLLGSSAGFFGAIFILKRNKLHKLM